MSMCDMGRRKVLNKFCLLKSAEVTVELKEKICDEEVTVRVFIYLGDRLSTGEGYEAAVTAKTRCGCVKLRKCGYLLNGIFPLMLKGTVYKGYIKPLILYESEAWCQKKSEMGIL